MKKGLLALFLVLLSVAASVLPLMGALLDAPPNNSDFAATELSIRVKSDSERVNDRAGYAPGELLVKFVRGVGESEIAGLRVGHGTEELGVSPFSSVRRWRVPASRSVEEWAQLFGKNPLVKYAEPNYIAQSSMVPNDPGFGLQWHLDNAVYGGINAKAAWDMVTGDSSVVVAVVDSGVAYEDNVAPSYWHIDTYRAYSGSGHSWWCGVSTAPYSWTALFGATAAPGYGNSWKEYLQHPFDLRSATGTVTFSYQYRCDLENGFDFGFVEISSNGGYNWVQLKNYTSTGGSGQPQWRVGSLDLSSFKGNEVLVRFRIFSDETVSDEDYYYNYGPTVRPINSDGAFFVDEIRLTDQNGAHTIFYDNVESGAGSWVPTAYEQAPDLVGTSFLGGWDFVNQDAHPNDDNGHGTHVTGTIAQSTNNGVGVAGVAFGTTIMPVKVLNSAGSGTYQWIADGIRYAVDNGADIISMSLGGSGPSTTLEEAVAYAYNNGVVVVTASGNDNAGTVSYPAAYDAYVIAVGATQYDETRAPYSNYGSSLDIVAPGGNTGVNQNGDGYVDGVLQNTFGNTPVDWSYWFYQGTSMATPHVSGVAALLLARDPTLTPDEVRYALQSTADDLGSAGRDNTFGWGLVNAEAALRSIARPVHLLLNSEPAGVAYSGGQSLTFRVTVLNELNPPLNSTLTLTITGPNNYYHYDFQTINVTANTVGEFTFNWNIPAEAGTYVVETSLVPAQLTAYDASWIKVN